jgi:peptidoglycan hydrolase-like protein with peptidoglycan-binding domain
MPEQTTTELDTNGDVEVAASSSGRRQPTTTDIDERLAARRRRWPSLLAGLAIGGAATYGVTIRFDQSDDSFAVETQLAEVVELSTVEVGQRDLIEQVDWTGSLSAGQLTTISSPTAGTITASRGIGDTIGRGDVVQLETNLSALGFNADGDVTIDDTFTSATAIMVEAWQEALGVDETGSVARSDVVLLAGESTVISAPTIGALVKDGAELLTIETPSVQIDVIGWEYTAATLGEVTWVAEPGTNVEHGTALYSADGVDALAVLDVSPETQAVLDAMEGANIEELESVLRSLGYDPDEQMEIDNEADLATVAAIIRWQEAVDLPATGSPDRSDYVVIDEDEPYKVATQVAAVGDQLAGGALVVTLTSPTLALTADVSVAEVDEFAVGDVVIVEQADETIFNAVVAEIGETTTADTGGGAATVEVVFGTVTVTTESSRIDNAIVVPTRALVTLREGGFAVEVQNPDGTTRLVGIDVGTYDDGLVEVINGELAPGDLVVVPS